MSQEKQLPTGGTIPMGKVGRAIKTMEVATDYNLESPKLSRPRLNPIEGALAKLDIVESRLQAARAHGDEIAFGRYYLAWCRLHSLAFSYGRFAREGSDG